MTTSARRPLLRLVAIGLAGLLPTLAHADPVSIVSLGAAVVGASVPAYAAIAAWISVAASVVGSVYTAKRDERT